MTSSKNKQFPMFQVRALKGLQNSSVALGNPTIGHCPAVAGPECPVAIATGGNGAVNRIITATMPLQAYSSLSTGLAMPLDSETESQSHIQVFTNH